MASAEGDYDPESEAWNGLSSFVEEARRAGVTVVPREAIDYGALGDEALAVIYPTVALDEDGMLAYLRRGGRVLLADDFGRSAGFLEHVGIRRNESAVRGGLHFRGREGLPIAAPTSERHVLTVGVRRLLTNHPATFITDLPPVYVTGDPPRTLVAIGAIGEGRLVVLGDPSVLINNMLEVPGNRRFARNLVRYLAGGDAARSLVLVTGGFSQSFSGGGVPSASEARARIQRGVAELNGRLGAVVGRPVPPVAKALAASVGLVLALIILAALEPRPRLYSGRWLQPATRPRAAGFVGTLEYLKDPRASHIYPLMILKRVFEERLLDGLGLGAPARLEQVLEAYQRIEPSRRRRQELKKLLTRLGNLSNRATSGQSTRAVTAREVRRSFELARSLLRPLGRDIEAP